MANVIHYDHFVFRIWHFCVAVWQVVRWHVTVSDDRSDTDKSSTEIMKRNSEAGKHFLNYNNPCIMWFDCLWNKSYPQNAFMICCCVSTFLYFSYMIWLFCVCFFGFCFGSLQPFPKAMAPCLSQIEFLGHAFWAFIFISSIPILRFDRSARERLPTRKKLRQKPECVNAKRSVC